jgi:sRNA-binding protein
MQLKDTEKKSWKEISLRLEKFPPKEVKAKYKEIKNQRKAAEAEKPPEEAKPAEQEAPKAEEAKPIEEPKAAEPPEEAPKPDEPAAEPVAIIEEASDAPVINVDPGDDPPDATSGAVPHAGDDEWKPDEVRIHLYPGTTYCAPAKLPRSSFSTL